MERFNVILETDFNKDNNARCLTTLLGTVFGVHVVEKVKVRAPNMSRYSTHRAYTVTLNESAVRKVNKVIADWGMQHEWRVIIPNLRVGTSSAIMSFDTIPFKQTSNNYIGYGKVSNLVGIGQAKQTGTTCATIEGREETDYESEEF